GLFRLPLFPFAALFLFLRPLFRRRRPFLTSLLAWRRGLGLRGPLRSFGLCPFRPHSFRLWPFPHSFTRTSFLGDCFRRGTLVNYAWRDLGLGWPLSPCLLAPVLFTPCFQRPRRVVGYPYRLRLGESRSGGRARQRARGRGVLAKPGERAGVNWLARIRLQRALPR